MKFAENGRMLVVDASCLVEQLVSGPRSRAVESALSHDADWVAPCAVDLEVLAVIQRHWRRGDLDDMTAALAVRELQTWPARRIPHGPLIPLAWQMRHYIRAADALYVALAQQLQCPLITLDARLARAVEIEVLVPGGTGSGS